MPGLLRDSIRYGERLPVSAVADRLARRGTGWPWGPPRRTPAPPGHARCL